MLSLSFRKIFKDFINLFIEVLRVKQFLTQIKELFLQYLIIIITTIANILFANYFNNQLARVMFNNKVILSYIYIMNFILKFEDYLNLKIINYDEQYFFYKPCRHLTSVFLN